jgi:hypothetical protein
VHTGPATQSPKPTCYYTVADLIRTRRGVGPEASAAGASLYRTGKRERARAVSSEQCAGEVDQWRGARERAGQVDWSQRVHPRAAMRGPTCHWRVTRSARLRLRSEPRASTHRSSSVTLSSVRVSALRAAAVRQISRRLYFKKKD